MRYSVVMRGVPFCTSEVFAVVPPMSSAITLGSPMSWPMKAAPMTPATGPDSTRWIGAVSAAAKVALPPLDCITWSTWAFIPMPTSSTARLSR